jgi:hypothetical protein
MIFQITTITTSADTAIVTTLNTDSFYTLLNAATTLTCTHSNGNVVAGTTVVFTCTGANAAETQDNVNKLQAWFGGLMNHPQQSVLYTKPYVMNQATITADAGLVFTGATTEPLTTTVVA